MRISVYLVILAAFAVLCRDALATTRTTDKRELLEPALSKNERKRSLRVGVIADEDSYAINEERVQASGISKVAKD
ncbi:hypothetical protein P3T76_001484 [Phytophthora citrophthora]|uniref:RxLR effector protein n=1 Tax=Phytophthora citrophthora TaxID=4793 RepID=A0AAD9GYL5_9STRA|nr:hypothetical protein P3T76_001484 [Phytophthora citrophthora]